MAEKIDVLPLIINLFIGGFFAFAMEKGRVFEPEFIRAQMTFGKFIMLKMFLSAALFSILSMTITYFADKKLFEKLRSTPTAPGKVILGCGLLGVGMTVSGACPGTLLVQIGAGVTSAYFALLGAIIGGIVFTHTRDLFKPLDSIGANLKTYIDNSLSVKFPLVSLPLALALLLAIAVIEYLFPWYADYPVDQNDYFPNLRAVAWPPYVSGMIIGSLQVPSIFLVSKMLGSSTAFETASGMIQSSCSIRTDYINQISKFDTANFSLLAYSTGVLFGGLISSLLSGTYGTATSTSFTTAFIGGFLIIYGARIAGGCTSGHGLSGFSRLSVPSAMAVAVMFSAAIGTALLVQF